MQSHVIFFLFLDLYTKIPFKTYSVKHTERELWAPANGLLVRPLSVLNRLHNQAAQPSCQGPPAGPSTAGACRLLVPDVGRVCSAPRLLWNRLWHVGGLRPTFLILYSWYLPSLSATWSSPLSERLWNPSWSSVAFRQVTLHSYGSSAHPVFSK